MSLTLFVSKQYLCSSECNFKIARLITPFVPGCRELIRDNEYLYTSSGFFTKERERERDSSTSLQRHHMLGFLILIWRDWGDTLHYCFNSPDYHSAHHLSSSFENLSTVVQDKNSLARLSQGGCYRDDREDCARCLLLSFNPDSRHRAVTHDAQASGTHFHQCHKDALRRREQLGDGVKIKRGNICACFCGMKRDGSKTLLWTLKPYDTQNYPINQLLGDFHINIKSYWSNISTIANKSHHITFSNSSWLTS